MAVAVRSNIVQITNISPSASSEQLRTFFGHIGVLEEFVIYPADAKEEPASKVAYIRYQDPINAEVALHLNNTMFLDRALIVLPLANGLDSIPDQKYADLVRAPPHTAAGVLPRTADWPMDVISMVVGRPGEQVIHTIEPRLSNLAFPLYPPLPATTDGSRIEEIRRTILVTNLDPKTTGNQVLDFFNAHAEVRCVRMAGTEHDRAAYVEFTQQPSIVKAFGLMGATLNGRQIMVQHSNCAIIKPANNMALFDDGSKAAPLANSTRPSDHRKYRARSRSRSHSRDRCSKSRRRSSSRRRRSRSRDYRRSRSRHSRRRSRSRSRGHRRRSRSYSRDRRRGTRGRSRSRDRKKYRRSRSRSERRRSSRSRSRVRHSARRDRDRGDRRRSKDRYRDKDRRERDYDKDRRRDKDKEHRRDSKSRRKRDDSVEQNEELNDSSREDKLEKGDSTAASSPRQQSPEATRDDGKRSQRQGSETGDSGDSEADQTQNTTTSPPRQANGTTAVDLPTSPSQMKNAQDQMPDNESPVTVRKNGRDSSASPVRSDSGDAMDTEA